MTFCFIVICLIILLQYFFQMKEQSQKKETCFSLTSWFSQLSFWKKIIIIFTLNTVILLILTDTIMLVLFGQISSGIVDVSNQQKEEFNVESNGQISGSVAKMLLSKLDLYGNVLFQLANAYTYFENNTDLFTSLEGINPQTPNLTSDFINQTFSEPAVFYLNSNSTFTSLPYIDELLPKCLRNAQDLAYVKRINVYTQRKTDENDLLVRTYPATENFEVQRSGVVSERFVSVVEGNYTISSPYTDEYALNSTHAEQLIGLRALLNTSDSTNYNIFFEIELKINTIQVSLFNIYYFPSASIALLKKTTTSDFIKPFPSSSFLPFTSKVSSVGSSKINVNGVDYLSATSGMSDTYELGVSSSLSNRSSDPFRCMLLVKAQEIEKPATFIQDFLDQQNNILFAIIFSWSVIILISTLGLSSVVGNYIFSNLKILSAKMEEYIKDPNKFHLIVIELKELELKGILEKLADNLVSIIEKIEVRKRERKDRISQNYHPLNIGQPKFQERQQLNDYEVMDQLKEEVRKKVQIMRAEAEEKQKKQAQDQEKGQVEKKDQ